MKKNRIKLAVIFGVEFVAIAVILLLIFFAGKKSYTVTFDLDGGTLLSGDLVQEIMQGGNATPPTAAKDGCYLHSWSASYRQITKDVTIRAVWEYETTVGVVYTTDGDGESSNYCEILRSFNDLRGDVYLGAYHDGKKVLGIHEGAFEGRTGIDHVYMLDGLISIGSRAFADCTSLESIVLPDTLAVIGTGAFRNCTALKKVTLPASLEYIAEDAFAGCTSLEEVIVLEAELEVEPEKTDDADKDISSGKSSEKAKAPTDTEEPEIYMYSALESIGARAFKGCIALESVVLPDTLREIGSEAFAGCKSLLEITLPVELEVMGVRAFDTPEMLINIRIKAEDMPEGWAEGWNIGADLVWEYTESDEDETTAEE